MRFLPLVLLLASCSQEAAEAPAERALYAGDGRDRLCIAGDRIGFIAFGEGDSNCSVRGRFERTNGRMIISPDGDADCRIEASQDGDRLVLGDRAAACAYYCGPGANFSAREFTRTPSATPAIDFAGDPLC